MIRRDGTPIHVGTGPLTRQDLQPGSGYDEAWLQNLLHDHPSIFPIGQVESGFTDLIPVCRELPLIFGGGREGNLDNVLVTAEGGLVLVETKLWRNPEARRKVVAQALDYAAAVFALGYERFDTACRKARGDAIPLAEVVRRAAPKDFDESAFVDALTLALRRGRAVVAVVGDGIREDVEALAGLLQSHAGDRFTFALVELAIYALPDGGRLVVPSALARTTLIERGVVRIEESEPEGRRIVVTQVQQAATNLPSRVGSLTEDEFMEGLDARDPALGQHLRDFLTLAQERGFEPEVLRTLNIKHPSDDPNAFNLGYIDRGQFVEVGPASWFGRLAAGRRYCERLALATGGFVRGTKDGRECTLRFGTSDKPRTPRLSELLPVHGDAWLAAMTDYIAEQRPEE